MIVSRRRNADAAGFCNALKPRRDVDAVSKDVMRLDNNVANIDADTKRNTSVIRIGGRKLIDAGLELQSGSNRSDRAWKLRQEPVAGILDNAAYVLRDCRLDGVL